MLMNMKDLLKVLVQKKKMLCLLHTEAMAGQVLLVPEIVRAMTTQCFIRKLGEVYLAEICRKCVDFAGMAQVKVLI